MSKIQAVEMGKYIEEYLSMSDISPIILLLDIRHTPTEDDRLMYSYILKKNIPFLIICNKADKLAKTKVNDYVENIKKELNISYSPIIPYSTEKKEYIEDTWDVMFDLMFEE